jgi:hypothetical protein
VATDRSSRPADQRFHLRRPPWRWPLPVVRRCVHVQLALGGTVRANYRFRGQQLFYCRKTGTCQRYDYVTNDGYVDVISAFSYGKKVTCPGASNRGKVSLDVLDVRYPDNALVTWDFWLDASNIPFNSNC